MAKSIVTGCLLAFLLLGFSASGWPQGLKPADDSALLCELGFRPSSATAPSGGSSRQDRGILASDLIRGNGTRAGYTLSRGGIVPNSESVTVNGSLLSRNKGYYLDTSSGMLAFAEPVRISQTIRVTYRYIPEKDQQRSALGAPSLALSLGPSTSLGITYALNTTGANQALDLLTYGVNLKTVLGAKSSMTNMMYVSSPRESGRVSLGFNGGPEQRTPGPKPKSDNLFVHNSDLHAGKLSLQLDYQDVGRDFSGFAILKQQKAAPDAVLAQLEKEKGLRRFGIQTNYSLGGGASTGIGLNQISSSTGDIVRQSLSFTDSHMKLNAEIREIDDGFKGLSALPAAEKKLFGKEIGMRRMNLAGDFTLGSDLQLLTSFARVTAKDAALVKYGLSLKGKKFDIKGNFQDIDSNFNRITDLTDPDKKTMAAEKGMRRYDLTTHFQASKSVTIDSFLYNAKHSTDDVFKRQLRNNIVISPAGGPKLSIFRDEVASGKSDAVSRFLHERFTLDHKIGTVSLNALLDTVSGQNPAGEEHEVETRSLHFGTDPKHRTSLIGAWKHVAQSDGRFEETRTLRLSSKLSSDLTFGAIRSTIETDQNDTVSQEYSLVGKVFGSVGLKSKFGETLVDGVALGKVRELSLVPSAPYDYGVFRQVNWNLGFSEVRRPGKGGTQMKCAKLESEVIGHKVMAEYSGAITKKGQTPVVRSFGIAGDQDPKKRLHYNLAYKVQDPGSAPSMLIRRYDADWRINSTTKLIYNYCSYNEKPGGKLEPIGIERLKLATVFAKKLALVGQWESKDDYKRDISKTTLSLGLSGNISALGVLEASYGWDRVVTPSGGTTSRTYGLKYDYQVSADYFITFSGKYTDRSGPRPANCNQDDVQLQMDFKTLFN